MDEFRFYSSHSRFTDPLGFASMLAGLPRDPRSLCALVHGLVVHWETAPILHDLRLPENRRAEVQTRYVSEMLARIAAVDDAPLTRPREPHRRFAGYCNHFALLLCATLRNAGIAARLRCGFATYWMPGVFMDHWVCESWDARRQRWELLDAEIGEEERRRYGIRFEEADVPRDRFLVAGTAWQLCRTRRADPHLFGVRPIGIEGAWFVRANLLRDLAALNKIELLPWDYTEFADRRFDQFVELPQTELALLDQLAALTADRVAFDEVRAVYETHPQLRAGPAIRSYGPAGTTQAVLLD